MNCNPTLTADEFKTVHNAICDLDSIARQLDGVVKDQISERLIQTIETIRSGLRSAYDQDNAAFDRKHSHYRRIQEELGLRTSWSLFEVEDLSDRHPFEGADRVVYKDHWGDKPVSVSINGLTWAALYVAADACIRDSGDDHHVFIERFRPAEDDPRTLILSTGS